MVAPDGLWGGSGPTSITVDAPRDERFQFDFATGRIGLGSGGTVVPQVSLCLAANLTDDGGTCPST